MNSATREISVTPHSHTLRGYLYIAAAALCWAISANSGKAVFSGKPLLFLPPIAQLNAEVLSQMRVSISVLLLLPWLLATRGSGTLKLNRKDLLGYAALGLFGFVASNFFYYFAIEKTKVTTAIIIQYTAPAWVLLYTCARHRQAPTFLRALAVAAAVGGSALASGMLDRRVELVWIGVASALLAAFSFAFSNIFGRELVGREEPMRVIFFSLLAAAIFWMVVHTPAQVVREHYNGAQWGYMFVFAITSVLLPYNFYFAGLKYLSATRAVVTSCLEAVFTITLAAIFLREHMGWPQIVGVVLVLTATIVVQMPAREVELPVA